MKKAEIILNEGFAINSRYRVLLKAHRVPASKKYPSGVKARFVMVDSVTDLPRLLVDNHEPYGFHMHTALPGDKNVRVEMLVKDHHEALNRFLIEAERIAENEKD